MGSKWFFWLGFGVTNQNSVQSAKFEEKTSSWTGYRYLLYSCRTFFSWIRIFLIGSGFFGRSGCVGRSGSGLRKKKVQCGSGKNRIRNTFVLKIVTIFSTNKAKRSKILIIYLFLSFLPDPKQRSNQIRIHNTDSIENQNNCLIIY